MAAACPLLRRYRNAVHAWDPRLHRRLSASAQYRAQLPPPFVAAGVNKLWNRGLQRWQRLCPGLRRVRDCSRCPQVSFPALVQ
ncbi:hypothetical protein GDO78_022015 [Eleutherodactylus coqui]|uniref:Uncharacterized protein n=1 Tax=Eleutherodactylus coqui TaxID=57060 RepID=A0A8J6BE59_ELECQ|nr:hypothetical protein GDO78_022015 [Eleutherodactylus coqui]